MFVSTRHVGYSPVLLFSNFFFASPNIKYLAKGILQNDNDKAKKEKFILFNFLYFGNVRERNLCRM
jgi:hypothetical protein